MDGAPHRPCAAPHSMLHRPKPHQSHHRHTHTHTQRPPTDRLPGRPTFKVGRKVGEVLLHLGDREVVGGELAVEQDACSAACQAMGRFRGAPGVSQPILHTGKQAAPRAALPPRTLGLTRHFVAQQKGHGALHDALRVQPQRLVILAPHNHAVRRLAVLRTHTHTHVGGGGGGHGGEQGVRRGAM